MLLLALGSVVVGFAFLVVSLLSQDAVWAWGCIVACVVGAGFVVADAVRRRQGPAPAEAEPDPELDPEPDSVPVDRSPATVGGAAAYATGSAPDEESPTPPGPRLQPPVVPAAAGAHRRDPAETATEPVADTGPAQEEAPTDVALTLAGLTHDVLVVDEHPRFHLEACTWLADRTTTALPAGEAVDLGFTPCAWCAPAAKLAAGSPAAGTG